MTNREWERPHDRAYETFLCPVCGEMFPTYGRDDGACPVCRTQCNRQRCRVLFSSNEGF